MSGSTVHDEAHGYDRLDSKGHNTQAGSGYSILGGIAILLLLGLLALAP